MSALPKYQIIYDKGDRLRLRFGKYAFTKEQGYGIASLLLSIDGVESVTSSHLNGGLLILHKGNAREKVLDCIHHIRLENLPEVAANQEQSKYEIDLHYQDKIFRSIFMRAVVRRLLPPPIGVAITAVRALRYLKNGVTALLRGDINVDVLDAASVTAAFLYKSPGTAASIMFMLGISDTLAEYTKSRARQDLLKSLEIDIDRVWVVADGTEVSIPIGELKLGDHVLIRSGSMIPIDGTVVDGLALVNETSMTGEPLPVEKKSGATVFAGTVVEEGTLTIEVRSLTGDSRMSNIIHMIDRSEQFKAGIQSKAEHMADKIVPLNFLLFGSVWLLSRSFTKALSVLMVDYSCAIKLSTPIAVLSTMREAAASHIVVKGGKFFETLAEADTVVFDKTGTLTMAVPKLEKVIAFEEYTRDEVLTIAACLEEHFPHSVARAIVKQAEQEGLFHPEYHAEVEYIVAHGIVSTLNEKRALIGSRHFVVDDEGVAVSEELSMYIEREMGHLSPIYLALGGKLIGVLGISDPPRAEAAQVISELKKSGIKEIIMITGDSEKTAIAVARQLGVSKLYANVLPDQKSLIVESLQESGRTIIMVGDGINDSPALAKANVSVAMKDASDIAREVADITLLNNSLNDLIKIRRISKLLLQRIQRNYQFIVGFNTLLLGLGLSGWITPNTSAFLHNASTLGVSAGSMIFLDKKQEDSSEK